MWVETPGFCECHGYQLYVLMKLFRPMLALRLALSFGATCWLSCLGQCSSRMCCLAIKAPPGERNAADSEFLGDWRDALPFLHKAECQWEQDRLPSFPGHVDWPQNAWRSLLSFLALPTDWVSRRQALPHTIGRCVGRMLGRRKCVISKSIPRHAATLKPFGQRILIPGCMTAGQLR